MNLYQHGLLDALRGFAAGSFHASDYLESCIGRTLAVEPKIAAFAHFDPSTVRAALRAVPEGAPLAGLPVAVKDIIATRGVPTEMGSRAFAGHVPPQSANVVVALERAGGLMFGKSVTTELAWRNAGATRNPWNLNHTPGGSSSGSAAAVAAGCVPAALGTQTFGSVIRPAAFCGIVGYKPSFGTLSRVGVHALAGSLDHVGVLTRSVVDAAFLVSVLAAGGGQASRPVADAPRRARIALLRTSVWPQVSAEQQAAVQLAATRFESQGALVSELVLPPMFEQIWDVADVLCSVEAAANHGVLHDAEPPVIGPAMRDWVRLGRATSGPAYVQARDMQRRLIDAFAACMASFDVVLTAPTLAGQPPGLDATGDAVLCTPFSVLGAPAITLPVTRSAAGLPLGIQLASPWGRDATLLAVAAWGEALLPWGEPSDSRDACFPAL